jgi:hypothetical protein
VGIVGDVGIKDENLSNKNRNLIHSPVTLMHNIINQYKLRVDIFQFYEELKKRRAE